MTRSPEPRVSGPSGIRKDTHDAARKERPTAGSSRAARGISAKERAGANRPKRMGVCSRSALVDEALCRAAHAQLAENRSRARQGRRRPGYLLQGLTCCAKCGYAYYGKTIRQLGAGRQLKDFIYYRCSGSDTIGLVASGFAATRRFRAHFWRRRCGTKFPVFS